ncbi:hypothetical protein ELH48_35960 (plasmid) [Rhizobium ruizarguesonis]|uniref:hypothetical protein n=1 Tax=Rhizobium TaxID=379 RepID=UPI0010327046|nr:MULTISPECIES: hypothetical protein [Rhizobium]MBB3747056.1 hypothetical protein [Rhizobium sp. BK591]TBB14958.1 hypothetical protein ELH48_35960 [Rhizobium ruizarguesonis]
MNRIFCSLGVAAVLFVLAPITSGAQDGATPNSTEQRDPNFCGAGGAGCDPSDVQQWKAIGNRLADLSSADLSQYAYACAKHADWKQDCETDPIAVLKRLGIEGY